MRDQHSRNRWLQFGITDLLLLTTVAAITVALCRPVRDESYSAPPWVIGDWADWRDEGVRYLALLPDGYYYYEYFGSQQPDEAGRWNVSPLNSSREVFVLQCEARRFTIGGQECNEIKSWPDNSNSVPSTMKRARSFEGPSVDGQPHGVWRCVDTAGRKAGSMEYQHGELVDVRDHKGYREPEFLARLRRASKLPPLSEGDAPARLTEGKRP